MRVDLSPRLGGGGHTVANQPPPLLSSSHSSSFSPPPERRKVSQQVWNSHELNLNLRFTLLWPYWLDYRVPTTPCTSRLKTKRLKTLSTYPENIAWIKSSWYYSRNIGGTCPSCPIGIDAPAHIYNSAKRHATIFNDDKATNCAFSCSRMCVERKAHDVCAAEKHITNNLPMTARARSVHRQLSHMHSIFLARWWQIVPDHVQCLFEFSDGLQFW